MGVPLSGEVYVRELELHQGCQGPFRGSGGKVQFLRRCRIGKWPHLALRGESPGFSRVAAGNLGFLLSYHEDLGTRSCCLSKVQSPWEVRGASQDYSPVSAES